jgi:hypothetical protein
VQEAWEDIEDEEASESADVASVIDGSRSVFLSSCGHVMHMECFARFHQGMLLQDKHTLRSFYPGLHADPFNGRNSLSCPLCATTFNTVMPLEFSSFPFEEAPTSMAVDGADIAIDVAFLHDAVLSFQSSSLPTAETVPEPEASGSERCLQSCFSHVHRHSA